MTAASVASKSAFTFNITKSLRGASKSMILSNTANPPSVQKLTNPKATLTLFQCYHIYNTSLSSSSSTPSLPPLLIIRIRTSFSTSIPKVFVPHLILVQTRGAVVHRRTRRCKLSSVVESRGRRSVLIRIDITPSVRSV